MSKDLHMKMDDGVAARVQAWADRHGVSFTAAVSVLCATGLNVAMEYDRKADGIDDEPKEIRR